MRRDYTKLPIGGSFQRFDFDSALHQFLEATDKIDWKRWDLADFKCTSFREGTFETHDRRCMVGSGVIC